MKSIFSTIVDKFSFNWIDIYCQKGNNTPLERPFTEVFKNGLYILFVVAFYWTVSTFFLLANTGVLRDLETMFDAPLFKIWLQCFMTVVLMLICSQLTSYFPQTFSFTIISFSWSVAIKVMPLTAAFFQMVCCQHLCFRYSSLAFYSAAYSLSTIFNIILTYYIFNEETTTKAILCCSVILTGFIISVVEGNDLGILTAYGIFYGLIASCAVALNSILTKYTLRYVNNNIWTLVFYNSFNSSIIFIVGSLATNEFSEFKHLRLFLDSIDLQFWFLLLVSGLLGFTLSYASAWQIKVTSPLTHNILDTFEFVIQAVFATIISRYSKSALWWLGNVFVVWGAIGYTRVRYVEMRDP